MTETLSQGLSAYTHARTEGAPSAPLFLTFHGTGGNEAQFHEAGADFVPGAHVISPRGDVSEGGHARYFRRKAEGVYDMDDLARATAKMAGFIEAARAETRAAEAFGLGYSNGANILASVAFARPELVETLVLMHPLIPFAPAPQPGLSGKRVLITAGRNDPICPPVETDALALWFENQGAQVTLEWHEGGHEIRREEVDAIGRFLDG